MQFQKHHHETTVSLLPLRLGALILFSALLLISMVAVSYAALSNTDDAIPDQTLLLVADLASSKSGADNSFLSGIHEEDEPFTHMLLRWEAEVPGRERHHHDHDHDHDHDHSEADEHEQDVVLEVRTSLDNQAWSEWTPVLEDSHLWMPQDGDEVFWSQIVYAGEGARFWQVRAGLNPTPDGDMPQLHRIEVNTVDGRYGRDSEPTELPVPRLSDVAGNSIASIDKPAVVSRTAWGNPDGQSSRVPPAYYPVNHLVVHHTVDPNTLRGSEQNWGDRVRAIWSFHTITRGWGDVGYNYLIAPDGVIYEGRAGGDDAVAFHDTGNYGSMGVSLIGTYQDTYPTPLTQDSLVWLLAWKANQKGIDPLGSSYYYGCDISSYCTAPGAVTLNIAGHRQISYATTCPGDAALDILPAIRNRVQAMIEEGGFAPQPDNGDLLIDELESSFARSDANWYTAACGYGGHTYYTFATDSVDESTNSATWRPTIPETGRYRVYAHIPQNCGIANPPYATTKAVYRIHSADGDSQRIVDHNTVEEWVDLGVYTFNAGSDGAVELDDLTGEPYSERKVIFLDSIKWVEEVPTAGAELLEVHYEPETVAAGELLEVTFKVRNSGDVPLSTQDPQAGTLPDGSFDPDNGYVYDEGECFMGNESENYPIFAKEADRFRVTLGATDRSIVCAVDTSGYPWRWGVNGELQPGETREIKGYVRFRTPGTITLQAGIIQEFVRYHVQNAAPVTIEVTEERQPPIVAAYNAALEPVAQVYQMGTVPDNFLARTRNPLSIPRADYIGTFAWDGNLIDWEENGPLGQTNRFLVEQTRVFLAPESGEYDFRTTTDDGSWLWVDDVLVVDNSGLHDPPRPMTSTIELQAGLHVLSFRSFERTSTATASYDMRLPGALSFDAPADQLSSIPHDESLFDELPTLVLAAHDQGGSGVATMRYSWDGEVWEEVDVTDGRLVLSVTEDVPCTREATVCRYRLRYQAEDRAGNTSDEQVMEFAVRAAPLPIASNTVTISHELTRTLTFTFTTDTGEQTIVAIPPGAVSEDTTLNYAELAGPSHVIGDSDTIAFADRAFELQAVDASGNPLENFRFERPITITLSYSDAQFDNEEALQLVYWDGTTWRDASSSCTPPSDYARSDGQISIIICPPASGSYPSEFALVQEREPAATNNSVYLPLMYRE